jgi:mono/diheme cytochrome c family protein
VPRALGGAFLAGLILVAGTACGTGGPAQGGNTSNGKDLFTKGAGNGPSCASCHTLTDANAKGTVGPNLDEAFAAAKANGFKTSTIQNVVLDQIRYPTKGSGMPANLVKGQDAQDVAAYVASAVGKKPPAPPSAQATGKELYSSLGCQSCHSLDGTRSTGPTFKGLFGSKVKLTSGQTVSADEAYLLASILDPDKQIVQGFQPGVMSGVIKKGQVSAADVKKLVDFIKQQK